MFEFAFGTSYVASAIFGVYLSRLFFLGLCRGDKDASTIAALMFAPVGLLFGVFLMAATVVLIGERAATAIVFPLTVAALIRVGWRLYRFVRSRENSERIF